MENNLPNYTLIPISEEMIGLRLDKALSLSDLVRTRSRAESLIEKKFVIVNGAYEKSSYKIKKSDIIQISFPQSSSSTLEKSELKLNIIFEDEHLLVVNKPPGLVVHPAVGHEKDTLVNALLNYSNEFIFKFSQVRPGIVHRLDKDTSGLLVIAKNDTVLEALAQQFKSRTVHRIYEAITLGRPNKKTGKICSYLARHPYDRKKYSSVLGKDKKPLTDSKSPPKIGKWAVTNFTVVIDNKIGLNLIKLKLETGRTHQIRVHLSEHGMPILSDPIYGSKKMQSKIATANLHELLSTSTRCALHAAELGFIHPIYKSALSFRVEWPDHQKILEYLKAYP